MVSNIISKISLNNKWQKISLSKCDSFYLIAIKDKRKLAAEIDPSTIKMIRFEIGIDSGIKNQPLTIQYLTLNFEDMTSGANEINKITAFTKCTNLPSEFYIRVISLDNGLNQIKSGEVAISVNINSLS